MADRQTVVRPFIDRTVVDLRPDFRAISLTAYGFRASDNESGALLENVSSSLDFAQWADEHVEQWRETFRAFGAKPNKTPSSVETLRSRVRKTGALPSINAAVDLYNAISVKYALPVGGEDLDLYAGQPRLTRASGDETFQTTRDGADASETPDAGEIIWRDDLGVTCRRWNWRQCTRTRISDQSTNLWFVLEALGAMPDTALHEAAQELGERLSAMSPGVRIEVNKAPA